MGTVEVYHKHPIFTDHVGNKTCGIINGHDASCSKHGMTNDNESDCEVDTVDSQKCKCTHKIPSDSISKLARGVFRVVSNSKKTASKKTASKKTASKKTASKKTASKKTASKKTASKKTARR